MKTYRYILNTPDDPLSKGEWYIGSAPEIGFVAIRDKDGYSVCDCVNPMHHKAEARFICHSRRMADALWRQLRDDIATYLCTGEVDYSYLRHNQIKFDPVALKNFSDSLYDDFQILLESGAVVEVEK